MNMNGCNSVIRGRFSEAAKNVLYANVSHTPPDWSRWHSRAVSGLKLNVLGKNKNKIKMFIFINEAAFSKREHRSNCVAVNTLYETGPYGVKMIYH